jgi:hypothetical protein
VCRSVAALLAVLVLVSTVSGFVGTAVAVQTTLELSRALDDQEVSDRLSFRFSATDSGTASVPDEFSTGGNVVFEFEEWDGGGDDGSDNEWPVESGETYEVEYEVTAMSGAEERTHSSIVSVDIDGQSVTSERLAARVVYRSPQFGPPDSVTGEVIVRDDESDTSLDLRIENVGDGAMRPSDVGFSGVPNGLEVSADDLPSTIDARDSASVDIEVTANADTPSGDLSFTAVVTDNVGNRLRVPIRVTVVKPAIADVSGDVDLGGIRLGDSKTDTIEIDETGGNVGIQGLNVRVEDGADGGSLSVRGGGSFSTSAGGSDELDVTVDIDSDAPQGDIEWELELTPRNPRSPSTTVDVEAYVLYPPELGNVEADDATLTFDEPQSSTDSFSTRSSVEIPNDGDLDMSVQSVSASTAATGITARAVSVPGTVGGTSDRDAEIEITADSSVPEGEYQYTVDVDTDGAGSDRVTGTIEVDHQRRLDVERSSISFGEIRISSPQTQSTDVSEALGYEPVSNVQMQRISGPDQYLEVRQRPPGQLSPGETSTVVFGVSFPPSAELYRTYTWEFELSGDAIDTRTIEVTATPRPANPNAILRNLSDLSDGDWQGTVTSGMTESITTVEDRLRDNETLASGDLPRTIAAAQSAILVVESIESARETRQQTNASAAQSEVVRAAAAQRALELYVDSISTESVRVPAERALEASRAEVDTEIERQEDYYTQRLESDDATALTRATAARRLARLRALNDQPAEAQTYRNRSQAAFDRYDRLVREGTDHIQRARAADRSINNSSAAVLFGRAVVLNPLRISSLESRLANIDEEYTTAAQKFEQAGAARDAQAVRQRRNAVATRLQQSVFILYGWSGAIGLGFLILIWWLVRQSVAYAKHQEGTSITSAVEPA